jgi:hypothetical protein
VTYDIGLTFERCRRRRRRCRPGYNAGCRWYGGRSFQDMTTRDIKSVDLYHNKTSKAS